MHTHGSNSFHTFEKMCKQARIPRQFLKHAFRTEAENTTHCSRSKVYNQVVEHIIPDLFGKKPLYQFLLDASNPIGFLTNSAVQMYARTRDMLFLNWFIKSGMKRFPSLQIVFSFAAFTDPFDVMEMLEYFSLTFVLQEYGVFGAIYAGKEGNISTFVCCSERSARMAAIESAIFLDDVAMLDRFLKKVKSDERRHTIELCVPLTLKGGALSCFEYQCESGLLPEGIPYRTIENFSGYVLSKHFASKYLSMLDYFEQHKWLDPWQILRWRIFWKGHRRAQDMIDADYSIWVNLCQELSRVRKDTLTQRGLIAFVKGRSTLLECKKTCRLFMKPCHQDGLNYIEEQSQYTWQELFLQACKMADSTSASYCLLHMKDYQAIPYFGGESEDNFVRDPNQEMPKDLLQCEKRVHTLLHRGIFLCQRQSEIPNDTRNKFSKWIFSIANATKEYHEVDHILYPFADEEEAERSFKKQRPNKP